MTFNGGWINRNLTKNKLDHGDIGLHEIQPNKQLCPSIF